MKLVGRRPLTAEPPKGMHGSPCKFRRSFCGSSEKSPLAVGLMAGASAGLAVGTSAACCSWLWWKGQRHLARCDRPGTLPRRKIDRGEPPPPPRHSVGRSPFIDPTECISDVACSVWVGGGRVHLRARRLKNEISRSTYWDLRTASPTAEIDAHIHKPERHTLRRVVSTVLAICRPRSNSVRAHLPPDISPPAAKPATTSKTR
jgi:hypothetical protein